MFEEDGERIYLASQSRLTAAGHSLGHKQLRSYGSCGSRAAQMTSRFNIRIVKHRVQRGDTLQGIALKYGVTMEEIKRENRLWTTDSLFLREYLDIPVPANPGEPLKIDAIRESSPKRTVSLDNSVDGRYQTEENIRDFLGRIDTSIKKTKSQIKELNPQSEESSQQPSYVGLTLSPAQDSVSYQNGAYVIDNDNELNGRGGGYTSVEFSPRPTVVTSGRKVTTSLQRHRREHEQMFEL